MRHASRSVIAAFSFAVAAAVAAHANDLTGPVGDPLCPPLSDPREVVVIDGVEVRPPARDDDREAAMALLAAGERDDRLRAAISLALAGNVPAFDLLLETRDLPSLSTYGRFYVNPDGLACVADEIEAGVAAGIADPELRPALTAFFESNLYRRRELFDRLIRIGLDDGRPYDFNRVVMALLATGLDGIEDQVLAQAQSYLVHDTPVRKQVLPGVHRRWVSFFGERAWVPAVGYLESLLLAEGYDETLDSLVSEYSQTRSLVYRTLDGLPSPAVAEVFIRQLERVVDRCPPNLVLYELAAFGSFAVGHAATDEQLSRVAGSLAALLGLPPSADRTPAPGGADYRVHKIVVDLLAELGTAAAAAVLVADLRRLSLLDDPVLADPLIVSNFEALRALPESTVLDVPGFLAAAAALADGFRLHNVPTILDAHPDPAAHAFYLDQLRTILDQGEAVRTRFQVAPEAALDLVIARLLAFDEPDQLRATRDALDGFFLSGELDQAHYVAASARINDLLGDESATFRGLQDRRRIAEEAEIRAKREQEAAEWRRVVDRNTSPEGIRSNLQVLDGRGDASKTAASWLVIAGTATLAPAYELLSDPEVSPEAELRLLQILGEIGDPRSIRPLIECIRHNADNRVLVGAGLQALALMPPSAETFAFSAELLEGGSSPTVKQQALIYLAAVRDPRGLELARTYSAAGVDPEVRVAGLLLAARLGDREVEPAIVELLATTDDRSHRDVLLRALAELSALDPPDTSSAAGASAHDPATFGDLQPLVEFRRADGERKVELARRLIDDGHPWDRREAVGFLVEGRHSDVLFWYLQPFSDSGLPLLKGVISSPGAVPIYAQIRRMGFQVAETPDGLELVPAI